MSAHDQAINKLGLIFKIRDQITLRYTALKIRELYEKSWEDGKALTDNDIKFINEKADIYGIRGTEDEWDSARFNNKSGGHRLRSAKVVELSRVGRARTGDN